ncbi:MAG TPA: class I SAM-dependent methyltransferase [Streptosporangiaceae bacterium]
MAAELAALPPGRAIDLGTGEGRNAIWLAERGFTVTAVDFSRAGLARAAGLAAGRGVRVDWVHADLLDYQPTPGGYDLVLIAYIQLTANRLTELAATAAAALAPGGTLLAVGHDRDNLSRGHGGPRDPGVLWTTQLVTAGLAGLTIQHAGQVNRTVTTPDGDRTAIDTLIRAQRPTAPGRH